MKRHFISQKMIHGWHRHTHTHTHKKRCSTSSINREMLIKSTVTYDTPIRTAKKKFLVTISNAGEDMKTTSHI